ncbi:integrase, catalytic region, zinc finger, CCHC-type containing protein [Tanacetum coccineum]
MSQEIVHIAVNSVDSLDVKKSCVNECNKFLELVTKLLKKKDLIEKDVYDKLLKSYSTLEKHCISLELTTQLNQESQEKDTVIRKLKDKIKSLSGKDSVENVKKDIDDIETINIELEYSLKNELRKLKGKIVVDTAVSKPSATIVPGMFKLNIKPISHRLKNNRDAHEVYIEKTIENTNTLRGLELLVYVSLTCPNLPKPSKKLVVVTPMNKDKRVRFAEPVTSSCNIPKQIDSLKTKDFNKPLFTSTGVKPTTRASGSKPLGNTKNNRITRPPSRNQKIKVEDHSRKVKSSLNKMNSISEPVSRTFTIVGNKCPLTRITSNKIVPPKETTIAPVVTPTSGILVYSRRPKATRSVIQIVLWYLDSGCSKHMTGNRSQLINFVSKFLGAVRFENDHIAKIMGYGDYQMGNVTISWVYYVEGLGHNLFFVGQFCDSDLEDEVSEFMIKFLKMIQVRLNGTVRNIRTDNGTEFFNQTLKAYYEEVKISHQTSMARTPQQNGIVERRNHTLVEAARNMLIFSTTLSEPRTKLLTPGTISSGLVPNIPSSTPYVPPTKNDWEYCFSQSMQEELNKFKRLKVWELVPHSDCVLVITLKWIYKVKLDELGVARLEAICIFIAFAALMNMVVYQMDVKTAFLNGIRREEISQSPRGIFLNQSKHALESLKKYGMETCEPVDTPKVEKSKLDEDPQGKAVDPYTLSLNDWHPYVSHIQFGKTYRIPLDLHPRLHDPGFIMDHLPGDAIGIYSEFLWFSGIRIPFSTFLLSVLKYFKDVCMDDGPLSLKKWKDKFFLIDRRAIPDYLTWRHSCSCVSNDLPTDGYAQNDVERLCARLIYLHEMREEVLVRSGLKISIYDFMDLLSWGGAKVVEESHHLSSPLLERVPSHTTTLAAEGAMIPLPTTNEIVASLPDPCLAKKSKGPSQVRLVSSATELGQTEDVDEADLTKFCTEIENSLERDKCISTRATLAPTSRLGKRLGDPPSVAIVSASGPSRVGTSAHASTSGCSFSLGGVVSGQAGKSRVEVVRRQMDSLDSLARSALARDVEYDPILKDDFGTATHGKEIDLTLFSLAPGPYQIALLVSHGEKLNSRYTGLVTARNHLQEKFDRKAGYVKVLRSEVTTLDGKLERMQKDCDALGQENKELLNVFSKNVASDKVKELLTELTDARVANIDGLREEVARFIGFDVESLVQKLLSSDEFYAVLAHIASLSINFGVERGLRMGPLVDFPTTLFHFLGKVVAASVGTLFEVTQILPDKHIRSVTSAPVVPSITNEDVDQVSFEHASDVLAASI